MNGTRPKAAIRTELQRVLYAHPEGNVSWLAKKLGVSRQTCGIWVRGLEKIPRRRQAQIRVHLEAPTEPLFDERGCARRLDGTEPATINDQRSRVGL